VGEIMEVQEKAVIVEFGFRFLMGFR